MGYCATPQTCWYAGCSGVCEEELDKKEEKGYNISEEEADTVRRAFAELAEHSGLIKKEQKLLDKLKKT